MRFKMPAYLHKFDLFNWLLNTYGHFESGIMRQAEELEWRIGDRQSLEAQHGSLDPVYLEKLRVGY